MSQSSKNLENNNKKDPNYIQGLLQKLNSINKVQNKQDQAYSAFQSPNKSKHLQKNQQQIIQQQYDQKNNNFSENPIRIEDQDINQVQGKQIDEQNTLLFERCQENESIKLPQDSQIPLEYLKKVQQLISKYNKLHQNSKLQNNILEQMILQRQPTSDTVSKFLVEKYQNGKNLQQFEKDYHSIQKLVELLERKILVLDQAYVKKRQNEVQYKLIMEKLQEEIQLLQNICVQMINMRISQLHPFQRESRKQALKENKELDKSYDTVKSDKRSFSVDGDLFESSAAAQSNLKQQLKINQSFDKQTSKDKNNFVNDLSQAEGVLSSILSISQISSQANGGNNNQQKGMNFKKNQNVDQTLDELSEIQQDIKNSQKALMSQDINETILSFSVNIQDVQETLNECSIKLKQVEQIKLLDNQQIVKMLNQIFEPFYKQIKNSNLQEDGNSKFIRSLPNLETYRSIDTQIAKLKDKEIKNYLNEKEKQIMQYQYKIKEQEKQIKLQEEQIIQLKEQQQILDRQINSNQIEQKQPENNNYNNFIEEDSLNQMKQDQKENSINQIEQQNDLVQELQKNQKELTEQYQIIQNKLIEEQKKFQETEQALNQEKQLGMESLREEYQKQIDDLSKQIELLNVELQISQKNTKEQIVKQQQLEQDKQMLQERLIEQENNYNLLQEQKLSQIIGEFEPIINKLKEDSNSYQILNNQLKAELENDQIHISQLESKIKELNQNMQKDQDNQNKEMLKQNEFQKQLEQEISKLQKIIDQNKENIKFLNQEIIQLKENNQQMQQEIKNEIESNKQLKQNLQDMKNNEKTLNEKISQQQQEIKDFNLKINMKILQEEQFKLQINLKKQEITKLQEELSKFQLSNQQQKEKIESLQRSAVEQIQTIQMLKEQECEQKIKEIISEKEDQINQLVEENSKELQKQRKLEIEQILTEKESIKNQEILLLKQKHEQQIKDLEQKLIDQNKDLQLAREQLSSESNKCLELQKQLTEKDQTIENLYKEKNLTLQNNSQLENLNQKLIEQIEEEKQNNIHQNNKTKQNFEDKIKELETINKESSKKIEQYFTSIKEKEQDINNLNKERDVQLQKNQDLQNCQNRLKQSQQENIQINQQLEDFKNQVSQLQKQYKIHEQQIDNLKLNVDQISKENLDQKKTIESLQEQNKIAEQQKAQYQKQLEIDHKTMIDWQNQASNSKKQILELKQQINNLESQNQQQKKQNGEESALQNEIIIYLQEKSRLLIGIENKLNHKIIDQITTFSNAIECFVQENKIKIESLKNVEQNLFSIDSSSLFRKLETIQMEIQKLKKKVAEFSQQVDTQKDQLLESNQQQQVFLFQNFENLSFIYESLIKNQKNLQIKELKSYFEKLQKLFESEDNLNKKYFKEITGKINQIKNQKFINKKIKDEQQELSLKLIKLQHDIEIEVFKIHNQTLDKVDKIQKKIFPGGMSDQSQFEILSENLNSILNKFENEFKQVATQAQGTYWDYGKENRLLERKLIDIYEEVKKMREGQFSMKLQLRKKEMQDFDSFNQISKNLVNQLNKFQTIIEGLHVTQFSPVRSSYNVDMFNQNNEMEVVRSSSNPFIKNLNHINLFGSRKSQMFSHKFEKVDEKQENEENAIPEIDDEDEDFKKFQENLKEDSDKNNDQSKDITSLQNLSSTFSPPKKRDNERISSASVIALALQNDGGPQSNTSLGKISPFRESMNNLDGMRQSVSRIENEEQRNIRFILEELKKIKQNVEKVVNSLLQYNFEEINTKILKQTIETLETELTEYKNYYQQSVGHIQGVFDELQQIGDPVYQFSQLNGIFKKCCTDLQDFYKMQLQSQDIENQNMVIEVVQQVKQLGTIVNNNLKKQIQEILK